MAFLFGRDRFPAPGFFVGCLAVIVSEKRSLGGSAVLRGGRGDRSAGDVCVGGGALLLAHSTDDRVPDPRGHTHDPIIRTHQRARFDVARTCGSPPARGGGCDYGTPRGTQGATGASDGSPAVWRGPGTTRSCGTAWGGGTCHGGCRVAGPPACRSGSPIAAPGRPVQSAGPRRPPSDNEPRRIHALIGIIHYKRIDNNLTAIFRQSAARLDCGGGGGVLRGSLGTH